MQADLQRLQSETALQAELALVKSQVAELRRELGVGPAAGAGGLGGLAVEEEAACAEFAEQDGFDGFEDFATGRDRKFSGWNFS